MNAQKPHENATTQSDLIALQEAVSNFKPSETEAAKKQ